MNKQANKTRRLGNHHQPPVWLGTFGAQHSLPPEGLQLTPGPGATHISRPRAATTTRIIRSHMSRIVWYPPAVLQNTEKICILKTREILPPQILSNAILYDKVWIDAAAGWLAGTTCELNWTEDLDRFGRSIRPSNKMHDDDAAASMQAKLGGWVVVRAHLMHRGVTQLVSFVHVSPLLNVLLHLVWGTSRKAKT